MDLYEGDNPLLTVLPDSSAIYEANPANDGKRMVMVCSADCLQKIEERFHRRPFVLEELWAGKIVYAVMKRPEGKRVIFVTLEDGSGLVDIAFFEDSHERVAHTVFHSGLLLVRGTVEARGARRTVVGEMVWNLDEVAQARRDHGPQAALDLLGRTDPAPTPAQPAPPQRTLADGTAGARLHPYADLQPAGTRSADLRRLGHRSPGSAG